MFASADTLLEVNIQHELELQIECGYGLEQHDQVVYKEMVNGMRKMF